MIFILINFGCGQSPKEGGNDIKVLQNIPTQQNYTTVQTFFATDRNISNPSKGISFGNKRDALKYGICTVSIPFDHTIGEIETPSIWRLEFSEDPEKHIVVLGKKMLNKDSFFSMGKQSEKPRLFLFIHGYNSTFEKAAQRTAQMAYDLDFDGIPMFYSWPSLGAKSGYTLDSQTIDYSSENMFVFINQLIANLPNYEINLIAHSMGTRGLTKALMKVYQENPEAASSINQVILAAPDIDAEIFVRDIAPKITKTPVTLYASSNDKALQLSKEVNGYPRAGDSGKGILVVDGVETIDASELVTGFTGHSYFGDSKTVISDIDQLLDDGVHANKRLGLHSAQKDSKRFWKFKK